MNKGFLAFWVALTTFLVTATSASAAITLPESIDVTAVEGMAAIVLTALGTIWCIRKLIKMVNKS
jgi:hypothetical protein